MSDTQPTGNAGQPAIVTGKWEMIGPPECPLMFRRTLLAGRFGKLLWHRFMPGASDRDPHDHPRSFVTIVLRGGYDDIRHDGRRERLRAPAIRYRPADHEHVTEVHDDGATTLVIMGRLVRPWGFVRDGKWWPWRLYETTFGMAFRCEDDES